MKKRVAIIGVTGSVGQEFVQSLDNHPWFEVTQIAASERSAGKMYLDAIRDASGIIAWDVGGQIPEYIKNMKVLKVEEINVQELDLIFSAVESEAARDIETKFAKDLPVISTSSAYRYEEDVPILIPGINDEQAELLEVQKKNRDWKAKLSLVLFGNFLNIHVYNNFANIAGIFGNSSYIFGNSSNPENLCRVL